MRFLNSLVLLATLSVYALATHHSQEREVLVGVRNGSDASRLCSKFGKVVGKDAQSGMWIVALRGDRSSSKAIEELRANPLVELVLPESSQRVDTTSYVSVDEHLQYIEASEKYGQVQAERSDKYPSISHQSSPSDKTLDSRLNHRAQGTGHGTRDPRLGSRGQDKRHHTQDNGSGDFYEALRYYLRSRVNQQGYIDFSAIKSAYAHKAQMPIGRIGAAAPGFGIHPMTAIGTWSFIGPNDLNIPYNTYYGTPPLAGRISAIAYDPTASSTMYVGSGGGGLWKSTNSGASWSCISDNAAWQYDAVDAIAIDPKSHNTIYVGTGDFDGFFAGYNQGVMKSTDGGATWANVTPSIKGISDLSVSRIVVDPDNDQIVNITTGRGAYGGPNASKGGIWRSANAGATWTEASGIIASDYCALDVSLPSGGSRTYYAAAAGTPALLYQSRNQGASWTKLSTLPDTSAESQWTLATSKVSAGTLYALFTGSMNVYKSTNSGYTWANITSATFPNGIPSQQNPSYNWSQATYDYFLGTVVSSQASAGEILFCGLITVAYSTDGGNTWVDYGNTYGGTSGSGYALMHNDQHQFASSPSDSSQVLIGNDGGLSRINLTWSSGTPNFSLNQLNVGLGITQLYGIAPHPTNLTEILGGSQDNASPSSLGDLSNWVNPGQGDGGFAAWDLPESCFLTSSDGGAVEQYSLSGVDEGSLSGGFSAGGFIQPMVVSNSGSKIIIGTNDLQIYDFATPSAGFTDEGVDLTGGSSSDYLQALATASNDEKRIYSGSTAAAIYMTADLGSTYKRLDNSTLPKDVVGAIAANPTNENDVLVGFQSLGDGIHHLWRCTNVTASTVAWTNVSGSGTTGLPDVPVNAIVFDPFTPSTLWYVGTDVGVFMTTNAGSSWSNVSTGLPVTQVFDLKYANGYLYAGTFGRGIYRIALAENSGGGGGGNGQGGIQSGAPWPKFRSNVVNVGLAPAGSDATPAVAWSYNIGHGSASFSSAAIATDGSLYVGADNGDFFAFDSSNGAVKWAHLLNGEVLSSPLIGSDGTVYAGTLGGSLFAFSPSNGAVKWDLSLGGAIYSSPTIDSSGTIYVGGGNSLYAVNSSTGALKWTCATGGSVQSSPSIGSDGTVYVGSSDKHLYAVNPSTGAMVWARLTGGQVTASPAVGSDGTIYFGDGSGDIYALNPPDGSIKWARSAAATNGSPAIGPTGLIYFGCSNGRLYAYDSVGSLQWEAVLNGALTSSPAVAPDGTIYIGSEGKDLYAIKPTGSVKWMLPTGGEVDTSPAIDANGVVYVGSDDGYFFATNGKQSITQFYANPHDVSGGQSMTGFVTVTGASPGAAIQLSSNSSSVVVPASAPATAYGISTVSFTITTKSVSTFTDATVAATFGGSTSTLTAVVSPSSAFSNFYTLPASIVGGFTATGVIQTFAAAPSGGLVVSLRSGTSYLKVPASVTIPAGKTGVSFSIGTTAVQHSTSTTLVATAGSNTVYISVPIEPYPVTQFYAAPSTVVGGTTTFGYISISGPAASGGETIALSSNSSAASVPASITITAGSSSASFAITTKAVSANTHVTLTATVGATSTATTLTVQT